MNAPTQRLQAPDRYAAAELPLLPSLERRRLQSYLALMLGDIAALFAAFTAAGYLYLGPSDLRHSVVLAQLLLPVILTIALYNGAYSMHALARARFGIARILLALCVSAAVVVFIAFYTKSTQDFSRLTFGLGVFLSLLLMTWMRLQMRAFIAFRCGASVVNELVIDDGGAAVDMPWATHVSAGMFGLEPALGDPHALHRIGLVLRNADRVVVTCPPERRAAWAIILKGANVDGEVIDDLVPQLGALGARQAAGHGWLQVSVGPLGLRARIAKRLFDLAVTVPALLFLAPLLALVAIAIKLEDRGPVLFVQRRLGRSNRFFSMYKFRSMSVERSDSDGNRSAARDDDRVTRVGRILRRTSVDELPQLFNVLRGDMSLVGPRPHAIGSHAGEKLFWEVDTRYWQRHALKPGLTGLAQVRGWRGATDHESDLAGRLHADLEYLNAWSLWRDMAIVLATFRVVIHDRAF
ncbi:MAG: sugar transferase [Novosphingobium sp.]|nr:sugar transferase [Novosphingobium sp.]